MSPLELARLRSLDAELEDKDLKYMALQKAVCRELVYLINGWVLPITCTAISFLLNKGHFKIVMFYDIHFLRPCSC